MNKLWVTYSFAAAFAESGTSDLDVPDSNGPEHGRLGLPVAHLQASYQPSFVRLEILVVLRVLRLQHEFVDPSKPPAVRHPVSPDSTDALDPSDGPHVWPCLGGVAQKAVPCLPSWSRPKPVTLYSFRESCQTWLLKLKKMEGRFSTRRHPMSFQPGVSKL